MGKGPSKIRPADDTSTHATSICSNSVHGRWLNFGEIKKNPILHKVTLKCGSLWGTQFEWLLRLRLNTYCYSSCEIFCKWNGFFFRENGGRGPRSNTGGPHGTLPRRSVAISYRVAWLNVEKKRRKKTLFHSRRCWNAVVCGVLSLSSCCYSFVA